MVALAVACAIAAPVAQAKKAAPKVLTVCKHGCVYTTIQKAVNAAGRKATIKVKPGKYVEGVIVSGHKHDGLHIIGLGNKPSDVVL
jgi:pectin methylesterase-like acyl-CoA thioesterase